MYVSGRLDQRLTFASDLVRRMACWCDRTRWRFPNRLRPWPSGTAALYARTSPVLNVVLCLFRMVFSSSYVRSRRYTGDSARLALVVRCLFLRRLVWAEMAWRAGRVGCRGGLADLEGGRRGGDGMAWRGVAWRVAA